MLHKSEGHTGPPEGGETILFVIFKEINLVLFLVKKQKNCIIF